jgi:hypothetical protein
MLWKGNLTHVGHAALDTIVARFDQNKSDLTNLLHQNTIPSINANHNTTQKPAQFWEENLDHVGHAEYDRNLTDLTKLPSQVPTHRRNNVTPPKRLLRHLIIS